MLHEPVAAAAVVDEDHDHDGHSAEGVQGSHSRFSFLLGRTLLLRMEVKVLQPNQVASYLRPTEKLGGLRQVAPRPSVERPPSDGGSDDHEEGHEESEVGVDRSQGLLQRTGVRLTRPGPKLPATWSVWRESWLLYL